jgi:hypothetical protein
LPCNWLALCSAPTLHCPRPALHLPHLTSYLLLPYVTLTLMPSNTDNITLVAPRPVRLSNFSIHIPSPHRQHTFRITSTPADPDRLFSADPPLDDDPLIHLDSESISPKASPRASPRYVLYTEYRYIPSHSFPFRLLHFLPC